MCCGSLALAFALAFAAASGAAPAAAADDATETIEASEGAAPSVDTDVDLGADIDWSEVEEIYVQPPALTTKQRLEAVSLVDQMSALEISKFAASDIGEAIKRVPGVNLVEGQFAVIRGLEDRYSSTLFNSAVIPSPDPDRQSVQLDLFPSDVVSNLSVAKTFEAALPSNSSGGSIDVATLSYPETLEASFSAKGGFNDNAIDEFLGYRSGSPVGAEVDGIDTLESEFGATLGGRHALAGRELRFKGVWDRDIDYDTSEGYLESLEPYPGEFPRFGPQRSGDLALGQLSLSGGRFDLTVSERSQQDTGYGALGLDLDEAGNHGLDATVFYTQKKEEVVQRNADGYLPTMDYARLIELQQNGDPISFQEWNGFATLSSWIARTVREDANESPSRGPLWFASFAEHKSFVRERDLLVSQLNGDHRFEALEGFYLRWAANYAKTTQDERAQGVRMFFEPDDTGQIPMRFPVTVDALGPGSFVANRGIFSSENDIEEKQGFGRLDAEYERELAPFASLVVSTGGWYEYATRDVDSSFLESPSVSGSSQFALFGDTPQQLGSSLFGALDRAAGGGISGLRRTLNDSTREIRAWNAEGRLTLWEDFDALGGLRYEDIQIESNNDPFTGQDRFGAPDTFPTRYLFFDRLDNPGRGEVASVPPPGTSFNDQILGISVPIDPITGFVDLLDRASIEAIVDGEIDETKLLPAAGFAYRPIDGMSVRGGYSRTVARPSFREMGFYVSVEPATDDLIVGNPQLQLSDVESFDGRIEYLWGDLGDLAAFSAFYKRIDDPIESIVVRDPLNFEASSALYRTFFNNPSQADLWGIEAEARKSLGFLGPELLDYFSIGGNFSYIDAEVDRSEVELARAQPFFRVASGDTAVFRSLSPKRRLFAQPEWIANGDFTIDHPDWGTRLTLAVFAISDVLDAAGSAVLGPDGDVKSATLDRYIDSYYQIDLIASQDWRLPRELGVLTFKLNVKNLTDTTRRIVYDPDQTAREYVERAYKIGRDFSFSIEYSFSY